MSEPCRLLLARHGEAEYESDLLADSGGSLTAAGRAQSAALADRLATEDLAAIWSSPLSRAVQTSEIVAARLGLPVTVREDLAEVSVGSYAGRPVDPDPFRPTFERWMAGDLDVRIEGSETGREVADRLLGVLDRIAEPGRTVLAVSHGLTLCAGLPVLARNLENGDERWIGLGNTALIEVVGAPGEWWVESWDRRHIEVRLA